MSDLCCIVTMVALVGVALWYVTGCERLKGSGQ